MIKNRYFKFKDILISNCGDYILQAVSNLETGTATKRKINYVDTDGASWKDIWYQERPFEISGFIKAENSDDMVRLKRRLISSCSLKEPFELIYFNRDKKYRAECYFDKLPTFSKRKNWILEFKLYITIPGFYWESAELHTVKLFGYSDCVITDFTLPCVFTERISEKNVINNGDVSLYPIFMVHCENSEKTNIIEIINETTSEKLLLNYKTSESEIITIDVANAAAISNINGNITNKLDITSDFPKLLKGENKIKSMSLGNVVVLKYRERFLGV